MIVRYDIMKTNKLCAELLCKTNPMMLAGTRAAIIEYKDKKNGTVTWTMMHPACAENSPRNLANPEPVETVQTVELDSGTEEYKYHTSNGILEAIKRGEIPGVGYDHTRKGTEGRYWVRICIEI